MCLASSLNSNLLPQQTSAGTTGARELTAAACAFGNSLTLPLVFLAALLPAGAYERAVGYTALFLMGWSPLLWSVGLQLLGSAGNLADETGERWLNAGFKGYPEEFMQSSRMQIGLEPAAVERQTTSAGRRWRPGQ